MYIEISVGVIALAFVALVVFLIMTLVQTKKTLKTVDAQLKELSTASTELIENVNALTEDIQEKSEALDVVFRPLRAFKERLDEQASPQTSCDKIADIMENVAKGIVLFGKIKEELNQYVRSK